MIPMGLKQMLQIRLRVIKALVIVRPILLNKQVHPVKEGKPGILVDMVGTLIVLNANLSHYAHTLLITRVYSVEYVLV